MATIALKIAGPSYQDRSSQLSSQYLQNCYLGPGRSGESDFACYDWPGAKPFLEASGADRGMVFYLDEIYKVSGTRLVSVSEDGVETERGTVPGAARCIFAVSWDESIQSYGLLIATGGSRYYYDQSAVTEITDVDLTQGNSVAVMNDVAIFDNEDGVLTHTTYGAPSAVSSFYANTNTTPDGLQRVYVFGQLLYAFGSQSTELWAYNNATAEFIFTRQEQATMPIGLMAVHSVASDENYMYLLGSDRRFYRVRNSYAEPIVTPGISNEIESMQVVDDAHGFCIKFAGQSFYVVSFPTESKTLVYSATYNYWCHIASGTGDPERHIANSYVYAYGKHYISDYRNGNVYQWDLMTYSDNGEPRRRVRRLSPLTGAQIGLPGRSITASSLTLDMEVGVGIESGQGSSPQLMCRVSGDGGKTWSEESLVSIGALGEYSAVAQYDKFWTGRSIVYEIACSDPVYLSIFSGSCEAYDGGY